jgi:hypothetical protein
MVSQIQVHEYMAEINLIVQLALLGLLILSVLLKKKRNYMWHGNTMLLAVIVNGLLMVSHMIPTFIGVVREEVYSFNLVSSLGLVHGIIGAVAEFGGIWLAGGWAFEGSKIGDCTKKRKAMFRVLVIWLVALGLGIAYYPLHLWLG